MLGKTVYNKYFFFGFPLNSETWEFTLTFRTYANI